MRLRLIFFIFIQAFFLTLCVTPCCAKVVESHDHTGNSTITHLNSSNQTQSIESYSKAQDGSLQILCIERFEWHPTFPHLLMERAIEDNLGNTLISQTSGYDEQGQLIEEIMRNHEEAPFYVRHSYIYNDGGRLRTTTIEKDDSSDLPEIAFRADLNDNQESIAASFFSSFEQSVYEENDFFLRMSGQDGDLIDTTTFPGIEVNNVRVTFINGIMNNKNDFLKAVKWLSDIHGGLSIHFCFKPTEGWAWDLLKSSLVKLGIVSNEAYSLAETWKRLISEMGGTGSGGTIIHYSHSIGGTHTNVAKTLMTRDELKMIQVITFGSPTVIPTGEFKSVINYISVRDGVLFFDPIARLKALFSDNSHIVYVGTYYGVPFVDHFLANDAYRVALENHAKAFVDKYFLNVMPRFEIADHELNARTLEIIDLRRESNF